MRRDRGRAPRSAPQRRSRKHSLGSLAVALALVLPTSGLAADDGDAAFLAAVQLAVEKKPELALPAFRAYLQDHRDHPRIPLAQLWIGDLELGQSRPEPAAAAYEAALRGTLTGETRQRALLGLGRSRIAARQDERAVAPLEELSRIPVLDPPRSRVVHGLLADLLQRLRRDAEALPYLRRLAGDLENPESSARQLQLGEAALRVRHLAAAADALLQFLQRFPEQPPAAAVGMRAAEAYLVLGRTQEAEQAFRLVLRRSADRSLSAGAQVGLGRAALARGAPGAARPALEAARLLFPDGETPLLAEAWLAECDRVERHYPEAERRLLPLLRAGPAIAAPARYFLALTLEEAGRPEDARRHLEAAGPGDEGLWNLRARLRRAGAGAPDAASLRALAAGGTDPAVRQEAVLALAAAALQKGDSAAAEQELASLWADVSPEAGSAGVQAVVARARLSGKDPTGALRQADRALAGEADSETRAGLLAVRGEALLALKQPEPGVAALRQALELRPEAPGARQAAAALIRHYITAGRADLARELQQKLGATPGARLSPGVTLLARADAERSAGRLTEARSLFQQALSQTLDHPDRLDARARLAELAASAGQSEQVMAELRRLSEDNPPPGLLARVQERVGAGFERYGQLDRALLAYEAGLKAGPDLTAGAELGLALGRVHAVQQRFAEAETRFRQVLEAGARADTSARALYELGWLFLDQDQPDVGESHFDRLLQEHPGHLLAADAAFRLGERAYARGRFPQAADRYRIAAAGSGPAAAPAGYKLGWALQQAGDHAGAAGAFARVADRFPKHALALESRVRAAQALIRAGEVAAARRALESVLERMNPGPEEQELLAEARCALAGLLLAASEWPAAREAVAPVARAELGRRGVRAQLLLAEAVRGAEGAGPALVELGRAARLAAPFPDLLAEARFRAAECRVQLGKLREAEATWREILSQFPGTEWAGRSRAKLAEMLPKGADSP